MNEAVHVRKYESQADRARCRDAPLAVPDFQASLAKGRELGAHQHQERRMLGSTSLSALLR